MGKELGSRSSISFVSPTHTTDESFPRPVAVPENQIVNKNEEAMFHCQFTAVPPPTQEWLFEGKIISNMSR